MIENFLLLSHFPADPPEGEEEQGDCGTYGNGIRDRFCYKYGKDLILKEIRENIDQWDQQDYLSQES